MQQSWQANMKELEVRLARSKAKWKLVIGHHPIKSQLQVDPHSPVLLRSDHRETLSNYALRTTPTAFHKILSLHLIYVLCRSSERRRQCIDQGLTGAG